MKKILIFSLLTCSLFLIGCSAKNEYEEAMEKYATDFYNSSVKGNEGISNPYSISISQLKNANEQIQAGYDLTSLESCTDDSYIEISFDENTKEIQEYKFYLQCK